MVIINESGDNQLDKYFNSADNNGGMICEGEASMKSVFDKIKRIHQKSFEDIEGKYIARDESEKTCAIRLPPTVFFKVSSGLGFLLRASGFVNLDYARVTLIAV